MGDEHDYWRNENGEFAPREEGMNRKEGEKATKGYGSDLREERLATLREVREQMGEFIRNEAHEYAESGYEHAQELEDNFIEGMECVLQKLEKEARGDLD